MRVKGEMKMKTKNLLVSVKCIIFLCLILFITNCATNKQSFPSELLGTWFYAFESSNGSYLEQAFIFNLDGSGTLETRQFYTIKSAGETIRVYRDENVKVYHILPSSRRGKIELIINNNHEQISFRIDNNYLIISGVSNNRFDQSTAKYRKLTDIEAQKWLNADGNSLLDM
jgi:hypothetical protein